MGVLELLNCDGRYSTGPVLVVHRVELLDVGEGLALPTGVQEADQHGSLEVHICMLVETDLLLPKAYNQ